MFQELDLLLLPIGLEARLHLGDGLAVLPAEDLAVDLLVLLKGRQRLSVSTRLGIELRQAQVIELDVCIVDLQHDFDGLLNSGDRRRRLTPFAMDRREP